MKHTFSPQNARVRFNKEDRDLDFSHRPNKFVGLVIQTVALAMLLGIGAYIVSAL